MNNQLQDMPRVSKQLEIVCMGSLIATSEFQHPVRRTFMIFTVINITIILLIFAFTLSPLSVKSSIGFRKKKCMSKSFPLLHHIIFLGHTVTHHEALILFMEY